MCRSQWSLSKLLKHLHHNMGLMYCHREDIWLLSAKIQMILKQLSLESLVMQWLTLKDRQHLEQVIAVLWTQVACVGWKPGLLKAMKCLSSAPGPRDALLSMEQLELTTILPSHPRKTSTMMLWRTLRGMRWLWLAMRSLATSRTPRSCM